MFNSEVNTQYASRFLSRALQRYESDCGCTCKPPLILSEIIALHDTFACSCTNAQSSGDSSAARRPQLCLIAQRKIGRIVRESIDSLVSHSRRTADLKCLNALSQSSPASSSTLGWASRGRWSTGVAPIATAPDGAGHVHLILEIEVILRN
ncbi:hypothetical protein ALC53_13995 [Atta colombica]|uniref:Uncharacterized protein n=1 Tax=Atta colombica TaxID=520822 RepID=A0A195AU34_9HYME|nr:hypothetical protein ALC53_13995 [Atta colombica]